MMRFQRSLICFVCGAVAVATALITGWNCMNNSKRSRIDLDSISVSDLHGKYILIVHDRADPVKERVVAIDGDALIASVHDFPGYARRQMRAAKISSEDRIALLNQLRAGATYEPKGALEELPVHFVIYDRSTDTKYIWCVDDSSIERVRSMLRALLVNSATVSDIDAIKQVHRAALVHVGISNL